MADNQRITLDVEDPWATTKQNAIELDVEDPWAVKKPKEDLSDKYVNEDRQAKQPAGFPASGVTRSFAQDAPSPDILEKPASLDFIKEERPKDTATVGGEAWKGVKSGLRSYLESTASLNVYGDQINDTDLAEKIKNAKSAGEKTFYETQEAEEKKNRLFRKEIGEEQQKDAAAVGDIRDIESVSDFGKWASWNMGQMGGQMLGIIPFMLGGGKEKAGAEVAVSGFQALKGLVTSAPGAAGQFTKFLAQWAKPKAVDIPIGVLEGGSIAGGQLDEVEQGKDTELHPFRGLAAAFVATKLEELGAENAVNNLIKGIGGKKGNLIKRIAQSTIGTGVGEGTEEFFQTYAEQFGINPNDIASKETFMQAVNGAAAGFIGGFGIGGVTGSLSRNKDVEPEPGTPDQQLTDTSLADAINQGGHKDLDDASLEAAIQTASELVNQNPNDAETFNILNSLQAEAEARKQASLETETIMPQVEPEAEQAAPDYSDLITTHAEQNGIEPSLLSAVAQADGGLMAISPQVSQYMGIQDAQDPDQNLEGGARYLSALLQHYQGDEVKALAAYKMGVAAVNDQFRIESAPKEVQDYIASVQNLNPTGLIDSGLRTGQVNGAPFGENEAVSFIQEKLSDGTFSKDDLTKLKDQHPSLISPLNDLITESLKAEISQAVGITTEGGIQDWQTQKTETLLNTVSPYSHTMGAPVSTPFGQQQTPTYMLGKEISGPQFVPRPEAATGPGQNVKQTAPNLQENAPGMTTSVGTSDVVGSSASWTRGKETFSGTIQSIDANKNLKIKAENGKVYSIRPDKVKDFKINPANTIDQGEIVEPGANGEAEAGSAIDKGIAGGIVSRVDSAVNNRERSNILVEEGLKAVPGLRLQDAEEAGRWAYVVAKGDATQEQFNEWIERAQKENRIREPEKEVSERKHPQWMKGEIVDFDSNGKTYRGVVARDHWGDKFVSGNVEIKVDDDRFFISPDKVRRTPVQKKQGESVPEKEPIVTAEKKPAKIKAVEKQGKPSGKLAGTYQGDPNEANENPQAAENAFKKDLKRYAKELNDILGWEVDRDKKGKDVSATTNIAPVGGDGHIILWKPNSEYGIYIDVSVQREYNDDSLKIGGLVAPIMYRATTKKDKYGGGANRWENNAAIMPQEFAEKIKAEVDFYDRVPEATTIIKEAQDAGFTEKEISTAFAEGEKVGQAESTTGTPEEIQEKIDEIVEDLGVEVKEAPTEDLTQKSTAELISDIFAIINDHIGQRGSLSFAKKEETLDEGLYQKIKPYLAEVANRAKARAFDVKAYLFGAVDAIPAGSAKDIYETAASRYIDEENSLDNQEEGDKLEVKEGEENATPSTPIQESGTTGNDRTGVEGSSAEDVQGSEKGESTPVVSGKPRTTDDGELQSSSERTELEDADLESAANGEIAGEDDERDSGVGTNAGDVAGVQRSNDYRIGIGELIREGGWKAAAKNNLDAIELVKKLDSEKREATPEEKAILVKYVGWGASELANNMFPGFAERGEVTPSWLYGQEKATWKPLVERMLSLLSPEEIKTAAKSTQYAHYTSESVIRSIYKAVERFGFPGGKILEPGMGTGHFLGLLPDSMIRSKYTGVEMDHVTSAIAKYLYPGQNIIQGDYTKQTFPNNFFDIGIGNPPFSQTKILVDPDYKKHRFALHDYFFAKTVDKVRPGGLLVFITSRYTMDKQNDKARAYLAERADLMGAIRLPQTAFRENAGTDVVTDVLFFRKKTPGVDTIGEAWAGVQEVTMPDTGENFFVNEYYINHPEMVLGTHSGLGKMRFKNEYTVKPFEGDIEEHFAKAVENLPENVYSITNLSPKEQEKAVIERDFNPMNKKEGGIYVNDKGQVMIVDNGSGISLKEFDSKLTDKQIKWLKDYVPLRDALKLAQLDQLQDGDWEASLKALQKAYDTFVKKNGRIWEYSSYFKKEIDEDGNETEVEYRRFKNEKLLNIDVEGTLAGLLEEVNEKGDIVKGPFLLERQIKVAQKPDIKNVHDALAVSLDEIGKLDVNHIAKMTGIKPDDAAAQLGDLIYEEPGRQGYVLADEYLSGDVVKKLAEAEVAATNDKKYRRNVEALKAVQPAPLKASDVTISAGSNWISTDYYDDFLEEVLGIENYRVVYSVSDNRWTLTGIDTANKNTHYYSRRKKSNAGKRQGMRGDASEWSHTDRGANEIFEAVLNNSTLKVTRSATRTEPAHTDTAATAAINDIAKKMRERFSTWVWEDADRAEDLLTTYNKKFNNLAGRKFDGSHLTLPGVSLKFKLHDHQKRAIWRILQSGNTYLGHAVGAGKTIEMIAAGMEMRRLGQINKPLYIVPNHMLRQFAGEFQELYPLAHIMVADEENFHSKNRQRFVARATLNNPDAIIMTHSSFDLIRIKAENIAPVRNEFIQQLRDSLAELQDDPTGNRIRIKQMEARIEQAEQRFDSMVAEHGKDNLVTFEEMGADFLFVDEAHQFRKLDFVTNRQAKGINSIGSKRAMGLYIKTLWLDSQRPGRSHVFASGTPITNTMAEIYSIMRFFIEPEMAREGIDHFDAWANLYGVMSTDMEMNAAGRYEQVERFAEFINIPELMSRVRSFMDVITGSQLGSVVNRPEIAGGQAEIIVTPPLEELKAYQRDVLQPRIDRSKAWKPSKDEPGNPDPLINIITDGRLASIDMRYVDHNAKNNPGSKLNKFIDGIIEKYEATKGNEYVDGDSNPEPIKGGAVIAFYNHGFGKMVAAKRGFDARGWLMTRLKDAGIPASQVAWIDDYDTAAKKEAMMQEVRTGKKRILLGSAKKMGTGMNVQKRLAALEYLDAPWYPADVEQPDGRIVRQGNQNKVVSLRRYATKGSYDASMWQMVARKSRMQEQAFTGDRSLRKIQDVSESSQYAMASALASGDERAIQLASLKADLERLYRLEEAHHQEQRNLSWEQNGVKRDIKAKTERLAQFKEAEAKAPDYILHIAGKIGNKNYDKRVEYGEDLIREYSKVVASFTEDGTKDLASINGFPLVITQTSDSWTREPKFTLRLIVTEDVKFAIEEGRDLGDSSPKGLVDRIVNQLNSLSSLVSRTESEIEDSKKELQKINKRIGAPFQYGRDLAEKISEVARLEAELLDEGESAPDSDISAMTDATPDSTESETPQYSTKQTPGGGVTESDLKDLFHGQKIEKVGNLYVVTTKGGGFFLVENVERIDRNNGKVMLGYGRKMKQNEVISGSYLKGEIKISKSGDVWTLAHESIHYLEDAGLLDERDIAVLKAHVRRLVANKQFKTNNRNDIGGAEDRADFLMDAMSQRPKYTGLVGRVMDKVYRIVDAMGAMFGKRTVGSIVRDVKSGEIYSKPQTRKLGTPLTEPSELDINRYMTSRKGTGNIPPETTPKPVGGIEVYHGDILSIINDAKKKGTYLKAPNGEPTKLTPSLWGYVRTDEFKAKFGDWEADPQRSSLCVDDNGEPLLAYHGTNDSFDVFSKSELGKATGAKSASKGFFFVDNRLVPKGYTLNAALSGKGDLIGRHNRVRLDHLRRVEEETEKAVSKDQDYMAAESSLHEIKRARESYLGTLKNVSDGLYVPDTAYMRLELKYPLVKDYKDAILNEYRRIYSTKTTIRTGYDGNYSGDFIGQDNVRKLNESKKRIQDQIHARVSQGLIEEYSKKARSVERLQTKEAFLVIKNPIIKDFSGSYYRDEEYSAILNRARRRIKGEKLKDGVILQNTFDGVADYNPDNAYNVFVVFSPDQIIPVPEVDLPNQSRPQEGGQEPQYKVEQTTTPGPDKPRKLKTVEEMVAWLNEQSKATEDPFIDTGRKQSSLSKKTYKQALESTLIAEDKAPDVLEYDVMPMQEQADLAADLINKDIAKAKRIALGQEEPEGKLRKGTVYRAVELMAHDQGDTELIAKLIRSPISLEMTKQGQEIAATRKKHLMETLGMKYYESPVNAVRDVEDTLRENVEKKTGKKVSKEAEAEAEAWEKKFADLNKTIAEQAAEIKKYTSQEYIDELIKKHGKEGKPRTAKPRAEYGAKNKVVTRESYEQAKQEWHKMFGSTQLHAGVDPSAIALLTRIGAYHFEAGARQFAAWAQKVVDDTHPSVKPYLKEVFEKAKAAFGQSLTQKIKKGIEKGRDLGELQRHVTDLTISFIEEGITDGNEVVEAVHNELRQIDPEITLEETRDAISGYGKWKPLTHDDVLDRYREIKQEQQLVAKLRDLQEKGAIEKTGRERQEMTPLARDLTKQVNELKKKYGLSMTDPATQLRSALEAYKRRMELSIADLQKEIDTRQKIVREKYDLKLDKEAKDLTEIRDQKRAERDAIFGKPEMTDEQRLKLALQAAKRSAAEYARRIAEHDFSPLLKNRKALTSEALEKAKQDRDDARKAYQELREAEHPGEAALKALDTRLRNELNRYKQMIANRDFSKQDRKPRNLTPELKRLMEQRDNMRMGMRAAAEAAGRLTNEDIERIAKLASVVTELREAMDQGGDRLAYGAAMVAYHNYIEDLRGINAPIKTLLSNRIQQYKAEYQENPGKAIFNLASDSIKTIFDNSVAMVASFDDSFMGRQGLKVLFTHPSAWWPGAKNSVIDFIKTLGGQETIDAMKADIYSRPNFVNGSYGKAGIIAAYEEQYPANLAERAPVIGRVFKASEAAFVGSGMRMRADLYDLLADQAKSNGKDVSDQKEFIEPIGKLINNLTARGSWGKHRGESRVTRLILWAPKMLMANINTLVGVDYWTNLRNPAIRREAGLNWLKVIGTTALIMAVASALGDDDTIEWDPRSTDFGKIKIGDTRFDITGGMGSIVVLAARIITGKYKSATTGIVSDYDNGLMSRWDAFVNFLANKTTPPMGIVRDWLRSKTPTGERFTPEGAIYRAMTPIAVQNFLKLKDDASADRLAGAIVDVFGINTSSYSDSEQEWNPDGSQRAQRLYQLVGEDRFKELNKQYNERVDKYIKALKRSPSWNKMSEENKQKQLKKGREAIQSQYLGK